MIFKHQYIPVYRADKTTILTWKCMHCLNEQSDVNQLVQVPEINN